ncbi:MAG: Carboxymuconolactone decarboxylase [Solirubrobacterales bacterium]|nr:Carboxymuconolactone decarboxylase [Solirubrobacterales bacterium]
MRPIEPLTLDTAPDDVRPLMEPWQDGLLVIGGEEKDGQFVGLLAHRPELLQTVLAHYGTFLTTGTLPTRLKELVRLVTADAIRCSSYCVNIRLASGLDAGVTEEDIAAARSLDATRLPADEIAALRYAGDFVRNPRALDENYAELKEHFSEEQIVELGIACATFMGFGNMVVAFGLEAGLGHPLERVPEIVA